VVETPRGSRAKFDYDPKLKTFTLSKSLLTGLTYPHDWGFVPSTKADDGDPIDIMVVHDAATFPGIVLTCRVIGILQIEQKSKGKIERNDRLFAVPRDSHSEQALKEVSDLSKPTRQELEKFFTATDELEDKKLNIIGWKGPKRPCRPSRMPPSPSRRAEGNRFFALARWVAALDPPPYSFTSAPVSTAGGAIRLRPTPPYLDLIFKGVRRPIFPPYNRTGSSWSSKAGRYSARRLRFEGHRRFA
jgi:inorganic pyrophosphatase